MGYNNSKNTAIHKDTSLQTHVRFSFGICYDSDLSLHWTVSPTFKIDLSFTYPQTHHTPKQHSYRHTRNVL